MKWKCLICGREGEPRRVLRVPVCPNCGEASWAKRPVKTVEEPVAESVEEPVAESVEEPADLVAQESASKDLKRKRGRK